MGDKQQQDTTTLKGFASYARRSWRIMDSHDTRPVELETVAGLFLYGAANNLKASTEAGITQILCVSATLPLDFPDVFMYLQLDVADRSSVYISDFFDTAFSFIDRALASKGKVLVHCFMGRSRTATIVIAFLIARHGLTLVEALRELRRVRPQAQLTVAFTKHWFRLTQKQQKLREEAV